MTVSTDEFDGVGGSYVSDPKTGTRTLVERTEDPAERVPGKASPESAADAEQTTHSTEE